VNQKAQNLGHLGPIWAIESQGEKHSQTQSAVVFRESYLQLVCYSSFIEWNKVVDVHSVTLLINIKSFILKSEK